ncbi:hypothetical protein CHUAL_001761 [Chamberlinius hualienensis]
MTKESGQDAYLPCKFNSKINCQWTKDNKEINVDGLSSYKWTRDNGENTDDCSINIKQINNEDVGSWFCSNKADSNVNSVKSETFHLSILSKIVTPPQSKTEAVRGHPIHLSCIFDHPGSCNWLKGTTPIHSNDRHHYNKNENSKDCSLFIQSFDPCTDSGNWTCQRPGNSYVEAVSSNVATLSSLTKQDCHFKRHDESKMREPRSTNDKSSYEEPKISINGNDVTSLTLGYRQGLDEKLLLNITCKTTFKPSKMSWLIHDEPEYSGSRKSANALKIDEKLKSSMINHLQINNQIELLCLVEYPNGDSHSAKITLVLKADQMQEIGLVKASSNTNTIIIIIIIFIVIILFGIFAAAGYLIWHIRGRNQKGSKRKESCESSETTNTMVLDDEKGQETKLP